jgi:hypothetical protein
VSGTIAEPWRLVRIFALVAVVGLAVGVLTLVAPGALAGHWRTWANSGAVWLVPAFFVGSFMPSDRVAAAAGAMTLVAAIVGYYASAPVVVDRAAADAGSVTVWVVIALVGGPVYGMAGWWWRGDRPWRRIAAIALLGGVFTAEGLDRVLRTTLVREPGWAMLALGIAIPLLLGRTTRERFWSLVAELPVILAALGVYRIVNSAGLWPWS